MKLDTRAMRHLTAEDWKVLAAVEQGSKNHELVPVSIIERFSRLKGGSSLVNKCISTLAKTSLIAKMKEAKYDGYRLTYGGLDYLALHTHSQKKHIYSVGTRVGVGKESDIMLVADHTGAQQILKIHRLGRISFRTVKTNRDYLKKNASGSWMYLSTLAARKEYAFLSALHNAGIPVPLPIAHSRHTIVMSLVDAPPLRQISSVPDPAALYASLIELYLRLAKHGLIHGDYNEFNILIREDVVVSTSSEEDGNTEETITLTPVVIDFPQMISMEHVNAEMYFDRDINCIKTFFERRFHFKATTPGPFYKDVRKTVGQDGFERLDATLEASGITKKMAKDLEAAIRQHEEEKLQNPEAFQADEDDEDDEEEDEDEETASDGEKEEEQQPSIVIGFKTPSGAAEEGMEKLSINDETAMIQPIPELTSLSSNFPPLAILNHPHTR
ncbi:Rio2, N-terminal-domain-containing protein [Triangularia verruculosa]|uniref:Serine/threonine-protein kinase RIO2 n=1 Tax=Triangularia verruculosa TaxID=2587418 RepID=A0AAN6XKX6_9PEZI|nr:Rio2, N-terminal-domain-containing protein [Triangularia verruculosa]